MLLLFAPAVGKAANASVPDTSFEARNPAVYPEPSTFLLGGFVAIMMLRIGRGRTIYLTLRTNAFSRH